MTTQLRISSELRLPVEAVTETFAVLAKRGAGKTYAASVLVEEMLRARLRVVVVDPIGAWWGLRSSADGQGVGFEIPILGGRHGDVPLEPTAGVVIADLIVDERLSAVLDLGEFSKNDRRRFVAAFLERLYQRNSEALHVVLEEADLFAPEGKLRSPGDEQMLGAVYDLVRRGRGRGLGCTLITQRSASISKEVLTQTEILVALRTTGPHDRKAIEEWIHYHGDKDERDLVLSTLASLPTGEAWVWWPVAEILKRVRIRERRTFDSSATPKPGVTVVEPKTVADVDLDALQQRMAATIERAKADDPRELRRQVAELKRQVAQAEAAAAREPEEKLVVETIETLVEVPALTDEERELLAGVANALDHAAVASDALRQALAEISNRIHRETGDIRPGGAGGPGRRERPHTPPRPRAEQTERREVARQAVASVARPPARRSAPPAADTGELSAYALGLLRTIAERHPMRLTRAQISTFSGRKPRSSEFAKQMAVIVREGYVRVAGGQHELTERGVEFVGDVAATPPSPDAVIEMWRGALPSYERDLFDALVEEHPGYLTREELSRRTGRSLTSSAFSSAISTLAKNGIAETGDGLVRASDTLFLEGDQ